MHEIVGLCRFKKVKNYNPAAAHVYELKIVSTATERSDIVSWLHGETRELY